MEKLVVADNQLPIYYYENEALHRFCITLYIKAGILYESRDEIGITHVFEHMIFRNINRVLDGQMKQKLDKMGAYFNGCTFKEFVEIKIIAANKHFSECADIISKIFEPIDILAKEYCAEIKRIKAEIREEDEKKTIDYMGQKTVWKDTSLSKSIAGKKSVISGLSLMRIREYAEEICTANNMFMYVTGAVTEKDINELANKVGKYKLRESNIIKDNKAPIPYGFMNRSDKIKIKKADYCAIRFALDFDMSMCKKAELDLLYDILFDGECSKIHEELSEKTGFVYSYSSSLEQYNNIGNFYFSYEIDEKNVVKSIKRVIKVFNSLKNGIEEELTYVKPTYVDNGDMDLDEPEKLNWIMAYESHILEQNYKTIEDRKKAYISVTNQDIKILANKLFKPQNLVISIKYNKTSNKKKIEEQEIKEIVKSLA